MAFRMKRHGQVLSAKIAHISRSPAFDTEILRILRRSEPLPKIPSNRPDEIDVLVPVILTLLAASGQFAAIAE